MDFTSAWEAAIRMLDERGQLLNGHLFRLVEGDDQLFRQVRSQLIDEGFAEERFGVGLIRSTVPLADASRSESSVKTELPHAAHEPESSLNLNDSSELQIDDRIHVPDWWLMSGGVIKGPMDLVTICTLKQQGEIRSADVIRQGLDGFWQRPEEIPLLAALANSDLNDATEESIKPLPRKHGNSRPIEPPAKDEGALETSETLTFDTTPSLEVGSYVRPDKAWSIKRGGTFWIFRLWGSAAAAVGGPSRLYAVLGCLLLIGTFTFWWRQPPPSKTIFREFSQIQVALRRLQERRAPRGEFDRVSARYLPRVKGIAERLKRVATESHPLENTLYQAAVAGLLPMLDNPMTPGGAIREFDNRMEQARKLIEDDPAN